MVSAGHVTPLVSSPGIPIPPQKKWPGYNQELLQHLTCPALTQQVYPPYSLCLMKGVSADGPRRP